MNSLPKKVSPHAKRVLTFLKKYKANDGHIKIDGEGLCISDIHCVFKNKFQSVRLSEKSKEAIDSSYRYLEETISRGGCVYGVNTGFGGSADVRHKDDKDVQHKLIVLLNVGFGEQHPLPLVKAAMLVRANSIIRGYSGVSIKVVELLVELLNYDIVPYVPKRGSISASGDLVPSSYIAACLEGKSSSKVRFKGKDTVASSALAEAKLSPVVFTKKDALGVVNASSFAATLAADVLYKGNVAILLTQAVVAMATEALGGRLASFNPVIHETCLPHLGQQEVARNIRTFLDGTKFAMSEVVDDTEVPAEGLRQDRYALRTSPQWLGPTLETSLESIRRISIELNSTNDNPIVDSKTSQILHCGNFQGTSTTVAMDQFRQSIQLCGRLLFALMSEIVDRTINNGLTPNLCGGDRFDMGFKGCEIAMASYTSELDYLTSPVSNHVLSAELRNQSVNSLALISARFSESSVELFQMQLTNIMCALAQAIDLRWMKNYVESATVETLATGDLVSIEMSDLFKLVPWYKFFRKPRENLVRILAGFPGPNAANSDGAFMDQFQSKMEKLTDELKKGKLVQEVAKDMGVGTRLLYLFLREELGIKFHDGEISLDNDLQLIFDAFNDGRLDDMVLSLANTLHSTW